jgi:predicted AlkP superfamily pyrophosphatase or phosphodiesterase
MIPRLPIAMLALLLTIAPAALPAQDGPRPAATSSDATADDAPVTILVSIDGFRPDYLDRGITPNLSRLRDEGVFAHMRPSFPSKTFPNHTAIVTGLRPDRNGIVGNGMIDPRRPGVVFRLDDFRQALDPFWWDEAEPIWTTAERAGVRTATMFWPGSEVAHGDTRPSDWGRYDENITGDQRVRGVIDWLRRPAAIRPRLITLYFDVVDTAGHHGGISSAEVNAAVAEVDRNIGALIAGARELGRTINLVVVSDHGMADVSSDRVVLLDPIIDRASYILPETGPYAAIEPAAGTDNRVYDALLQPHEHMQCRRKEDLPERLHYGHNPRVAAIICLADPGWIILAGTPANPVHGGAHGWDPAWAEMDATFIASGPAFRKGARLATFDNVDVYPLIARLIGVTARDSDGNSAIWNAAMAPEERRR